MIQGGGGTFLSPQGTTESPAPAGESSAVYPALQKLPSVTGAIHDSLLPPAGRCLTAIERFVQGSNPSYAPNHTDEIAAVIAWAGKIGDLGGWVGRVGDAFEEADADDGQQQTSAYVSDRLLTRLMGPGPNPTASLTDEGYEVDWQAKDMGDDPSTSDFITSQVQPGGLAVNGLAAEAEAAKAESDLLGDSAEAARVKIGLELKQVGLHLSSGTAFFGASLSALAYAQDASDQGASTGTIIEGAVNAGLSNAASALAGGSFGEGLGSLAASALPPGLDAAGELILPAAGSLLGASIGGYLSDKVTAGVQVSPSSVGHLVSSPSSHDVDKIDDQVQDQATQQATVAIGDSPRMAWSIDGPASALEPIPGIAAAPPPVAPPPASSGAGSLSSILQPKGVPTVAQLDGLAPTG